MSAVWKHADDSRMPITEAAAKWHTALRDPEATAATHNAFTCWLLRSPRHVLEYLRIADTWDQLRAVDSERRIDVDTLLEEAAGNVVPLRHRSN